MAALPIRGFTLVAHRMDLERRKPHDHSQQKRRVAAIEVDFI